MTTFRRPKPRKRPVGQCRKCFRARLTLRESSRVCPHCVGGSR